MALSLRDLARYRMHGKSEQAVREEWIFPLLLHLGYGPTTLNDVIFEEKLKLRDPVRKLGSNQYRVDYLPTVLGHGLWLIEAKAPSAVDRATHLAQAWSYATHPEVNVPLVVLADGARLVVHDLTRVNWDEAILDIPVSDLERQFDQVLGLLGARTVARSVRERVFHYLQLSLQSELDLNALSDTTSRVARIVQLARPQILENRRRVTADANAELATAYGDMLQTSGLAGLAQQMNVPFGWTWTDVDRGVEALMRRPTPTELEALWRGVADSDGNQRAAWGLRTFRLSVALRARAIEGCAEAAVERSAIAVRDHLLGFPHDPVAAAAHRLELPLLVLALRLVTERDLGLRTRVQQQLRQLDAEVELRLGPAGRIHGWALSAALLICRQLLSKTPWSLPTLEERTTAIQRLLDTLPYDQQFMSQYIVGLDLGDDWKRNDPLIDYTLLSLARYSPDFELSPEEHAKIEQQAERADTVGEAAREILRPHPGSASA